MPSRDTAPTLPEMMEAADPDAQRGSSEGARRADAEHLPAPDPDAVTAYDHLWFRRRPLT